MTTRRGRTPKYQEIADALRRQIDDGDLAPDDKLPTEKQLEERYDASRETVRKALALLVNEGLVISARPTGHFVRRREPMAHRPQEEFRKRPYTPEMDAFVTEYAELGREPEQTIEVHIVEPPAEVAKRLRLEPGELAVVRKRVRSLDGEPFNTNDSYFRQDMVQGSEIMRPENIPEGANEVLAKLGHRQVRALDEIHVRMPKPEEVRRLELVPGTPVAYLITTGFTEGGTPVRVALNAMPGDRNIITYERRREMPAEES